MEYIVDASIVVNYLLNLDPKLANKIKALFKNKDIKLYSHILLSYEITNTLRFSRPSRSSAQNALADYFNLPIDILGLKDNTLETALNISEEVGDTIYDACYHALALANNMTYITCDKRYYDRAKQLGSIELLS